MEVVEQLSSGQIRLKPASHPVCRGCGRGDLHQILDLSSVPLANALLTAEGLTKPEERYPLVFYFCPACALAQIGETVPPQKLFSDYVYASSFSEKMLSHARMLVETTIATRRLAGHHLVIEIASNDGYLLQFYRDRGIPVLGVEPAANIAAIAESERGIPTLVDFFDRNLAERLASEGRSADIIHAHNVFAHVPEPGQFLAALKKALKPDGVIIIEVPYLGDLIDNLEFDTIYHEHFSYFSLTAVERLARIAGMSVSDVERVPIHGGSLRMFLTHDGAAPIAASVGALLGQEAARGMCDSQYYATFASRVWSLKAELVDLLRQLKSSGKRLAAYGASAKGSTLMNAFGIGADLLDFVVDRSTLKQGRFTPGNRLSILPPEALIERAAEYVLLLTWNFADEILAQQQAFRNAGGRFIVPLPSVKVV